MIPRFTLALGIVASASLAAAAGDLKLPPLNTGDVVFQESGNTQSGAIALASRSRYTHTGLIEINSAGEAFVVEATGPVKSTPLQEWIAQGVGGRVTVKRLKGLDATAAKKALAAAHSHDGKPYDSFFYKGRDAIYCSELVHLAFADGAGISVGEEERIGDLSLGHDAVQAMIAARWRQHPACIAAKAPSLEACLPTLLAETLVTPGSVARDPKFETVFSNFEAGAE